MPKAEAGSLKALNNKMKSKGLQRLRWYCQVCEKQCRDENGFKMHTQSESHVRQMMVVGEDPKKVINEYSRQFQRDFLSLLKTGHGEKQVNINHFYQTYIANKEHVHMNSTKWPSLTEFAKYLGREGICRVEENDKGLFVAWIDDSPDAMRRREIVRRKEMQDKGDEEREQRMIREQIKRAQKEADGKKDADDDLEESEERALKRDEGDKVKLSFAAKPAAQADTKPLGPPKSEGPPQDGDAAKPEATVEAPSKPTAAPVSLKIGAAKPQPKNVFAAAKKNALAGGPKKANPFQQEKKMSEAERIMKEEMERNKKRSSSGFGGFSLNNKKQRTA
ncbi:domain of Kin17 curved DNA-binding protein-domain-containing protein [Truncatella angustata]|uniref:Domain of Kin17 curved DNA-binding protein-domain-containing protein n=1 Tax=Truncatella angustata TaxID=152316 RepID=A0A9P8UFN3_9PEZI|nr:domain of Kin17 curved DNA-binding protein-domain-containing protein [Truncatella angustata]KAH6649024.1 domain of Kin17 curved DNA-binding protein-domain-containing protein [Truncatella angustata]KAH8201774.1 hypothetical protein TruAng_004038 [Truncatella angustata]